MQTMIVALTMTLSTFGCHHKSMGHHGRGHGCYGGASVSSCYGGYYGGGGYGMAAAPVSYATPAGQMAAMGQGYGDSGMVPAPTQEPFPPAGTIPTSTMTPYQPTTTAPYAATGGWVNQPGTVVQQGFYGQPNFYNRGYAGQLYNNYGGTPYSYGGAPYNQRGAYGPMRALTRPFRGR